LRGLNRFFDARLSSERLITLAAQLGSDVPFFVNGTAATCSGRGEIVMPATTSSIVTPPMFSSTIGCPRISPMRCANSRASTATAIVAATTAAATSSGARDPANPCSRTVNKPADTGSVAPNTRPAAPPTAGSTSAGVNASTTQATPATPIPASMVGELSRALAACSERGRARNPTPNAFTNVATASPAVRATLATAIGIMTAVATPPAARPCTRAWSSSHSLTNAGPSGNADPPSAPET
jgi:hypothetical protein